MFVGESGSAEESGGKSFFISFCSLLILGLSPQYFELTTFNICELNLM